MNTSSQSSHPFSSISLSPAGTYAVASSRDVLHIARGSNIFRSVRIAQHFQTNTSTVNRGQSSIQNSQYTHMHDALRISGASTTPAPTAGGGGGVNVNVTDVAWSLPQSFVLDNGSVGSGTSGAGKGVTDCSGLEDCSPTFSSMDALDSEQNSYHHPPFISRVHVKLKEQQTSNYLSPSGNESLTPIDDSSVVAAAGSNGVIVAWHARSVLLGNLATSTPDAISQSGRHSWDYDSNNAPQITPAATIGQPEAVFLAHSRAINRLAWHPTGRRPYLLLSGSQDGLVKLWDRRATTSSVSCAARNIVANRSTWFGFGSSSKQVPNTLQNTMITTANWHCCSTYQPKCEAVRDIKWSPFIDDVFAMVAGEWLLIYDIRLPNRPMIKESAHAGEATSVDWHPTFRYKIATGGSRDRCVKVWDIESGLNIHKQDDNSGSDNVKTNSSSYRSENSESVSNTSLTSSEGVIVANVKKDADVGIRGVQTFNQNTLTSTISSGSTSSHMKRILSGDRFRIKKNLPLHVLSISSPVTRIRWRPPEDGEHDYDYHESMIAVATSPISGANAGGHGVIGLWSCYRPFMPISLCEGHVDGAVVDFVWATESKGSNFERKWQTVITVGRDGQCLLQNFSLGTFPIREVPCSTFALTNLSPFQPGYGSLQIIAVHQHVNSIGVIRGETAPSPIPYSELTFSVTDQGDLKDLSGAMSLPDSIDVAPEVTHLSRLAEMYITKKGGCFQTKVEICNHNATVAKGLNRKALTQMWKTLAIILKGSGLDGIPSSSSFLPNNPMVHVITPTLRSLLLQRADAGDVQSCVVLCEVMDVIVPPVTAGGLAKSRIPNLGIEVVREWYLSYVDLLQQMCLFTQAANLIRNCKDPVVGSLNQQSTTIHESCPLCGRPLQGGGTSMCRSCRRKVGTCFICHEPVKGMFVWCPGCGHGGHMDHALEWFGKNEVCPTGCGHKCNLFPK